MNFVILDLEWNGSYSRRVHRYVNEIIEFGALKVNDKFEILDKFTMLVKPQIGKKLSSHVESLTHITNDEIFECNNGFMQVAKAFDKFCESCILVTWGTSDIHTLIDNFEYYTGKKRIPFMKKYCNLQEYCEAVLGHNDPSTQLGLQTCADMLNIFNDESELHRAYADAKLSFLCMKELFDEVEFAKYLYDANDEFYKRITFKNKQITDLHNPLVDKSQLYFNCENCGKIAKQTTPFKLKNKSFIAKYRCSQCDNCFTGKISLKLKYDGITVNKKLVENKPNNEKQRDVASNSGR